MASEVSALFTADVRDDDGQSPLDRVLEDVYNKDDLDLGLYLINHDCGDDEGKDELMCKACYWGRLDVVEELVELHQVNPNGECVHHIIITICVVHMYRCEV